MDTEKRIGNPGDFGNIADTGDGTVGVTKNIVYCPDGVYRWVYEYEMLKRPGLLFTVWRVMALSLGIVYAFVVLMDVVQDFEYVGFAGLWETTKVFLIILAVLLLISVVAYLFVAASYGWKYMVLFEMDETRVTHIHMPSQFQRAQALGWLTAMAGAVTANPTLMGQGLLASARNSMTSEFSKVRRVKPRRWLQTIYVIGLLNHNQVYAAAEDFDFVRDFILNHWKN